MKETTKWVLIIAAVILVYLFIRFETSMGDGVSVEVVEPDVVIDVAGGGGYSAPAQGPKTVEAGDAFK